MMLHRYFYEEIKIKDRHDVTSLDTFKRMATTFIVKQSLKVVFRFTNIDDS